MKRFQISAGSIARGPKEQRAYRTYTAQLPPSTTCTFCEFTVDMPHVIAEHPLFWHVKNLFPYSVWDESRVLEHTMIVPKRHVTSLSEYTPEEATEYMKLVGELELAGNSIYSRSNAQATKSVLHQHTHAIRGENRCITTLFFRHAPHILWFH